MKTDLKKRSYDEIKKNILNNIWYPGYSILITQIAEELNMSRTPVREVLLKLEHEGLVRIIPRRGVIVEPLRMQDIVEIYDLLAVLEGLAARLLVYQVKNNNSIIEKMKKIIEDTQSALDVNDMDKWIENDIKFHGFLIKNCGSKRINSVYSLTDDQAYRARMVTSRVRPKPINSTKEHFEIYKAIKNGNEDNAEIAAKAHRLNGKKMIIEALKNLKLVHI
jgi:DNA-binding GntR family transcriptional regulator